MNKISRSFYMTSIVGGVLLASVLFIIGAGLSVGVTDPDELGPTVALYLIAMIPLITAAVFFAILLHKCWSGIQDGSASTTPGLAVGLLFVPIFNLYWAFRAIWGYSRDYNMYLDRHGVSARKLPENLFLAYCILVAVSFVPLIGTLAVLAALPIYIIMVSRMIESVQVTENQAQSTHDLRAAA